MTTLTAALTAYMGIFGMIALALWVISHDGRPDPDPAPTLIDLDDPASADITLEESS